MRTLLALIVASFVAGGLYAETAQTPQAQAQQALASAVRQLGNCQSQLGPLMTMQADIISGKYLDAETIKQTVERANPTFTFDPMTFKLTPKSTEKK